MGSDYQPIEDDHRGYRFGAFTLDVDRASLFNHDEPVPLRPQSFDVLLYLVERHGRLVEKQELLTAIWGKTAVTDDSLTHCLIDIRKSLGDTQKTLIRTVPRRGYIFDVPTEPLDQRTASESDAGLLPRPVRFAALAIIIIGAAYVSLRTFEPPVGEPDEVSLGPVAENSIAVLPFADMSESQDYAYFGDGLAEEILNSLVIHSGLRVTARTSSFSYRDTAKNVSRIARELRVANVLEGSVRITGDRAVVTAQLVSGSDGLHIWSETFDRELDDSVDVQREIAQAVARALSTQLRRGGTAETGIPDNAEAYDTYLQARFLFHRRAPGDLDNARELYRYATELEPRFARAWSGLAGTYYIEYVDTDAGDARLLQQLKDAAERAVALDESLAEGWLRLGGYYALTGDPDAAERLFRRALEVQPDDPLMLGIMAGRMAREGNLEMAIDYQRRALERDPLSAVNRANLSFFLYAAGHYEEAIRVNRMARMLRPESAQSQDTVHGHALIMLGRYREALEVVETWSPGPDRDAAEAMARLALGHNWRARLPLRRLIADQSMDAYVRLAELRAFCLEIDASFAVLDRINEGLQEGANVRRGAFAFYTDIAWSPFFETIRDDPRWTPWLAQFRELTVNAVSPARALPAGEASLAMRVSEPKNVR